MLALLPCPPACTPAPANRCLCTRACIWCKGCATAAPATAGPPRATLLWPTQVTCGMRSAVRVFFPGFRVAGCVWLGCRGRGPGCGGGRGGLGGAPARDPVWAAVADALAPDGARAPALGEFGSLADAARVLGVAAVLRPARGVCVALSLWIITALVVVVILVRSVVGHPWQRKGHTPTVSGSYCVRNQAQREPPDTPQHAWAVTTPHRGAGSRRADMRGSGRGRQQKRRAHGCTRTVVSFLVAHVAAGPARPCDAPGPAV